MVKKLSKSPQLYSPLHWVFSKETNKHTHRYSVEDPEKRFCGESLLIIQFVLAKGTSFA
jgi:hypothetical protein